MKITIYKLVHLVPTYLPTHFEMFLDLECQVDFIFFPRLIDPEFRLLSLKRARRAFSIRNPPETGGFEQSFMFL